jgi:hypothetical protein
MQFQSFQSHGVGTDYSMYLPGMGRIATTPISSGRKSVRDTVDMKRLPSPSLVRKQAVEKKTKTVDTESAKDKICVNDPNTELKNEEKSEVVFYRSWPGGPTKSFVRSKNTIKTNKAATKIQKMVRGKCARTQFRIKSLEHRLAQVNALREAELQEVQENKESQLISLRRKATHKQATMLKKQLVTAETANEGTKLIHYLRLENKKLRKKNDKIAASILALKQHNERLEKATHETDDNQSLLGSHYEKIKETNAVLLTVVPQYEAKLKEMQEALEIRQQYCMSEHKMKVMYVKLVGTLTEMVENHSNDMTLIDEITAFCLELPDEALAEGTGVPDNIDVNEMGDNGGDEYEEVSVADVDDSDSNNYDDYTVATMD